MKKILILFSILLLTIPLLAQSSKDTLLILDATTMVTDTGIYSDNVGKKPLDESKLLTQIYFKDFDCIDSDISIGGTNWPTHTPDINEDLFPLVLDTTAVNTKGQLFFAPYETHGVREWGFTYKQNWLQDNRVIIWDRKSCTTGKIYILK